MPAWTDRVMYVTHSDSPDTPQESGIKNILYTAIPSYTTSDHVCSHSPLPSDCTNLRSPETCCLIATTPAPCAYYHVRPNNPAAGRLSPLPRSVGQLEEARRPDPRSHRRLQLVAAHYARWRPSRLRDRESLAQRWALALVEERGSRGVHPTSLTWLVHICSRYSQPMDNAT